MFYFPTKKEIHKQAIPPLMCWDVYASFLKKQEQAYADHVSLKSILGNAIFQNGRDLMASLQTYDALVLTNPDRSIRWVSNGFYNMTGYSAEEAIGRKPTFLQGEKTEPANLRHISRFLEKNQHIKASLINYRKDGREYLCEIEIEPVFNLRNQLIHYLAFENEVHLEV